MGPASPAPLLSFHCPLPVSSSSSTGASSRAGHAKQHRIVSCCQVSLVDNCTKCNSSSRAPKICSQSGRVGLNQDVSLEENRCIVSRWSQVSVAVFRNFSSPAMQRQSPHCNVTPALRSLCFISPFPHMFPNFLNASLQSSNSLKNVD